VDYGLGHVEMTGGGKVGLPNPCGFKTKTCFTNMFQQRDRNAISIRETLFSNKTKNIIESTLAIAILAFFAYLSS
jgi:hypothetical protein